MSKTGYDVSVDYEGEERWADELTVTEPALAFGSPACTQRTAHAPQCRATGVISGANQQPKDVSFVREF